MPTTTIDGREIYYERRGSGDPMLLIQGLSGTHLAWGEPFLSALEPGLELITYDQRGIGRSGPSGGAFTMADLAQDAAGLLDALEIDGANVMGISLGGMVAQELALHEPDRVRSLTLGCTYCGGPDGRLTEPELIQRLVTVALSGDRELFLRTGWEANASKSFAADPANFEAFVAMATQLPAPVPVLMAQLQATMGHDTSARLASLDVPTLVIHGDEDQILDASNGRQIAGLVPGARLVILEETGHIFWWERPDETAVLVREHVAQVAAAG